MTRITPTDVLAAYAKTGLKPMRGKFHDGECACGLTALYVAAGGDPAAANRTTCAMQLNLQREYVNHFMLGFDDEQDWDDDHPGYLDGQAAARAVFGEESQ